VPLTLQRVARPARNVLHASLARAWKQSRSRLRRQSAAGGSAASCRQCLCERCSLNLAGWRTGVAAPTLLLLSNSTDDRSRTVFDSSTRRSVLQTRWNLAPTARPVPRSSPGLNAVAQAASTRGKGKTPGDQRLQLNPCHIQPSRWNCRGLRCHSASTTRSESGEYSCHLQWLGWPEQGLAFVSVGPLPHRTM